TSQNHGFSVGAGGGREVAGAPDLKVTHSNLYDGTVAGVAHTTLPVIAVQYHPEAAPGPHDSSYLFDDFVSMMAAAGRSRGRRSA
ncbi:MAG: carbamoyl phosphate synthase small subunit, partial [Gemmatimonadetes bacterium]|nr:carbamoyl phosphate synthase small subunit [Gemmatimonadota bacterium]